MLNQGNYKKKVKPINGRNIKNSHKFWMFAVLLILLKLDDEANKIKRATKVRHSKFGISDDAK